MTHIDQIIADALAGSPETHVAILAREVVRLREARAVVVPELTDEDYFCLVQRVTCPRGTESAGQLLTVFIRERARAIPADRVLGVGMLSIHPDVLNSISDALREIGDTAHNASTGPEVPDVLWEIREKAYEAYIVATDAEAEIVQTTNAHAALSSLRANQGRIDHV